VPVDTPLELRFDRFLLPSTAVRQSIVYYTGRARTPALLDPRLPELTPSYDPLERVVRFTLPEGATLSPNTLYTVEFPVAGVAAAPPRDVAVLDWGFRAFDGAPLDEQGILRISFRTGEHRTATAAPPVPTCNEIVSLFRCEGLGCPTGSQGCASCHFGRTRAPLGLRLTDRDALVDTAIGHVAHQTETGGTTGVPLELGERFGSGMPVIDPLRPENSYAFYKLLIGPSVYEPSPGEPDDCEGASAYSVAEPPSTGGVGCLVPSPDELERLRSWFVLGEAMPPPGEEPFFRRAEARKLAAFIRAGASCP
jgi:hypothetical protein